MKYIANLMNEVIPIFMHVIKFNACEMELIGVVPSVDMIENATQSDIINNRQ